MKAVNLIPAEQRPGAGGVAGRSGGAAYVVVALIAGIAALAALYGTARHEISSREGEVAKLTSEARQAEAEAATLAPYTKFTALREERLKAVQSLADTRFDWAHAMHELGRVLPHDVSLSSLSGTIGAPTAAPAPSSSPTSAGATTTSPVTSATPPGSRPSFSISGCTTGQPEVALTMDRLRLMNGVSEVVLHSSSDTASSSASSPGGSSSSSASSCPDAFALQVDYEGLPTPKEPTPSAQSTAETSK